MSTSLEVLQITARGPRKHAAELINESGVIPSGAAPTVYDKAKTLVATMAAVRTGIMRLADITSAKAELYMALSGVDGQNGPLQDAEVREVIVQKIDGLMSLVDAEHNRRMPVKKSLIPSR